VVVEKVPNPYLSKNSTTPETPKSSRKIQLRGGNRVPTNSGEGGEEGEGAKEEEEEGEEAGDAGEGEGEGEGGEARRTLRRTSKGKTSLMKKGDLEEGQEGKEEGDSISRVKGSSSFSRLWREKSSGGKKIASPEKGSRSPKQASRISTSSPHLVEDQWDKEEEEKRRREAPFFYKIHITCKDEVKPFPPFLPPDGLVAPCELRDFLLTKCKSHNPPFSNLHPPSSVLPPSSLHPPSILRPPSILHPPHPPSSSILHPPSSILPPSSLHPPSILPPPSSIL
jgi:hypothetical protein